MGFELNLSIACRRDSRIIRARHLDILSPFLFLFSQKAPPLPYSRLCPTHQRILILYFYLIDAQKLTKLGDHTKLTFTI
jgi:hypothetical protein